MHDFVIIGGGIVGLSTAWQLQQRHPDKKILLLEKEDRLSAHQTGRNSGVVHAGVYYKPGSLKAQFCRAGVQATMKFCQANEVRYEQCGKLIVATCDQEHSRMLELADRARQNGLTIEQFSADELALREPHISGCGAILVKDTGIVDYPGMCQSMARLFQALGGEIRLQAAVTAISERSGQVDVSIKDSDAVCCRFIIACTGLMADRVARMSGLDIDFQVIPYRGEYFRLPDEKSDIVKHLIYPVPDPTMPFLGVHLTRMIDGFVTVGPNAVQGWKREGYGKLNLSLRDTSEMLRFPGFWRLSGKYLRTGLREYRNSVFKSGYLRQVRKYCPSIGLGGSSATPNRCTCDGRYARWHDGGRLPVSTNCAQLARMQCALTSSHLRNPDWQPYLRQSKY